MTRTIRLHISRADLPYWILGVLILLSAGGFAVYYYYDRYVHADETIIDRQARQLEEKVTKNPQNPDLRISLADYYLASGSLDQALAQANEALKIKPDHPGALLILGQISQKKGDNAAALSYYSRIIELNKDNPMAKIDKRLEAVYYLRGTILTEMGKYAEAAESLKSALAIDATDSDAHYSLGLVYQKQNDHPAALKEFEQAVRFVPDFVEVYEGMASSYQALGQAPQANYARSMAALMQGKAGEAEAQLETVVKEAPDFMPAYLGLGLAYEKTGKRDQAAATLKRYLEAVPNDIAAQQALGRVSRGN